MIYLQIRLICFTLRPLLIFASSASLFMSKAVLLLATDVFGETPATASLCRQLPISSKVISPYQGMQQFKTEQQAYERFLASGGVAAYAEKIQAQLAQTEVQHVLGFGVGGSAWWMKSAILATQLQSATLFYASRVRHHLDVTSACATHFILAQHEVAYDAQKLAEKLQHLGHHAEVAKQAKHGFMNSFAAGFSLKLQTSYLELLTQKYQLQQAA